MDTGAEGASVPAPFSKGVAAAALKAASSSRRVMRNAPTVDGIAKPQLQPDLYAASPPAGPRFRAFYILLSRGLYGCSTEEMRASGMQLHGRFRQEILQRLLSRFRQ